MWLEFVALSVINFLSQFSYTLEYYVMNEYATYAIKDMFFQNVTLNYTGNVGCHDHNITLQHNNIADTVQEKVSQWSIYYSLCRGLPCLITSSLISSLSDGYGRQRLLFMSLIGTCMKMTLCTCAIHYRLNIYYFMIFGFVEGCTGGWITVLSISFAYIADLTKPGNLRSVVIAVYELVSNLGYFSGSLMSGLLIKQFNGYFYPSVVATAAAFLALFSVKFLPGTILNNKETKTQGFKNVMTDLISIFARKSQSNNSLRCKYVLCIASLVLIWIPQLGRGNVDLYFVSSYPICFSSEDVSFYVATVGSVQQFMTVIFIKVFQLCDVRDEITAAISCLFGITQFIIFGFAKYKATLYIAAAFYIFKFACVPILRSTLSKLTPENKQGSLFGVVAFFENVCSMSGAAIAGSVYSSTVSIYKGFVFFMMAGFYVVATILISVLAIKMREDKEEQKKHDEYDKIQEDRYM